MSWAAKLEMSWAAKLEMSWAAKLEMSSEANVSQQLRLLDGKSAIEKVPDKLKHFLEEAGATNS